MATTAVRKIYEFNKAMVDASVGTARTVASVLGDGVASAFHIFRDAGATVVGQAESATKRTTNEASNGAKQVVGQARSVAGRTADQASKGAKEVTGQARAQGKRAGDRLDQVADRTTKRAVAAVDPSPSSGTPYEQWSKADLYERAQELDIDGRSSMSKSQLIKALRA
jgi:ElaB/YqjD/DUF883 family membrane-anchored ribosome-binding protein